VRILCAIATVLALTCGAASDAQAQLRTRVHASGFTLPLGFVQDPTDRTVQFVVQQGGRIRVVRNGTVLPTDFLDLTRAIVAGGEQGLLGLAFAPDYAVSGRFYVNFTNPAGNTVVARFRRSTNPVVADESSRFDLRWGGAGGSTFIAQPFANHNGGNLVFGPDGFLYIGLGDGGSGDDPGHRAQNPSELLGKMLRIDVNVPDDNPAGYRVPADNPFVNGRPVAARPEIWSFGLRNPWRYSFDDPARGGTGALVIGDVGQNRWEEIDYEPRNQGGRNYGWRNREGAHDEVTSLPPAYTPLVEPIHEYDHTVGQSVTGGYVYRGRALGPNFRGRYFFADFVQGRVWSIALTVDSSGGARASDLIEHTAELSSSGRFGSVSSFGLDADGELYIVSYSLGTILKVLGPPMAPPTPSGIRIIRP
jgi:glucose/arabinose dehydrogenase